MTVNKVKVGVEKKEMPDLTIEEIKELVKKFNEEQKKKE